MKDRKANGKRGKTKFVAELEPGEWPFIRTAICLAVGRGEKFVAIASEHGCDVATINYALRSQKSLEIRSAYVEAEGKSSEGMQKLETLSLGNLVRHAEQINEQEIVDYNDAKIMQGNLKGSGRFRVGDGAVQNSPLGNTTIYQNVQILMNMKPEEQEKLLEESRRGVLDIPVEGHGAVRRLGAGDEEAHSRPVVVASESHSDV